MNKWPESITAIRHVKSAYNKINKDEIPGYKDLAEQFDTEYKALNLQAVLNMTFPSPSLLQKAKELIPAFDFQSSDYDTAVADGYLNQAVETGKRLPEYIEKPDIIYVSPYQRTKETLKGLQEGWPDLKNVRTIEDDRIREQEFGKSGIYNDWRLYFVFNPEQALLSKRSTAYEYKYEQGESLLDVRDRLRSFVSMLIREHGGTPGLQPIKKPENVMLVTHHLAIMAMRANLERWSREIFLEKNKNERPPNSSVTIYKGLETSFARSPQGQSGRLVLEHKNLVLY